VHQYYQTVIQRITTPGSGQTGKPPTPKEREDKWKTKKTSTKKDPPIENLMPSAGFGMTLMLALFWPAKLLRP
jgi:hypothetical protein